MASQPCFIMFLAITTCLLDLSRVIVAMDERAVIEIGKLICNRVKTVSRRQRLCAMGNGF